MTVPHLDTDEGLDRRLALHGWCWDARLAWGRTLPSVPAAARSAEADAWRALVDPNRAGTFDRRLQWAGLDADRVEALLHAAEAPSDAYPEWLADLARLRDACRRGAEGPDADLAWLAVVEAGWWDDPASCADHEPVAYAHLLWPLVSAQWQHVRARLAPSAIARLAPRARDAARAGLLDRLSRIAAEALHEACTRDRGAGYDLMLQVDAVPGAGQGPPVRYAAFCRAQCRDGLSAVLEEFPVLGRLLVVACTQWAASLIELLERVHGDRAVLRDSFGIHPDASLTQLRWGLSDPHRGGRTVVALTFAHDGRDRRVVYKPKDLRIEAGFQALVAEVTASLPGPPIGLASVVPRDTYGYVSCVAHEPCETPEALPAFYRNAGRLLAVLYVLGGSDCHYDNLIAHGRSLVLIDAETLFDAAVHQVDDEPALEDDLLAASVLRVGMLPRWRSGGGQALDVSALGVRSRAEERASAALWRHVNTDDMVWTRGDRHAPQPGSLPVAAGTPNPFAEHTAPLIEGFSEAYRRMMESACAARLADRIGAFAGVPRRFLLRDTRTYATVQREALAPAALRDARVRGRTLDQLTRSSIVSAERPPHWAVCQAELRDMEQLDIPYFDFPLGSTGLKDAGAVVAGLLIDDGLAQAVRRVERLSDEDLAWQTRLIHAAVQAGVATTHVHTRGSDPAASGVPESVLPQRAARTTAAVAALRETLVSTAVFDRTGAPTWLTLAAVRETEMLQLGLAPAGLYAGVAGMVAFLYACAGRGEAGAAGALAGAAMTPVLRVIHDADPYRRFRVFRDLGLGMSGLGGLLRLFEVLARNPAAAGVDWRTSSETLADALSPQLVGSDQSLDVFGGVAGAIGPLARMHRSGERDGSAAALARAANHLLQAQDPATGGWRTAASRRPLTGFAHGASGMGLALIEAGTALHDGRFVDAGARAFAYEASVFDAGARNWPDFRAGAPPGSCYTSWCHGAPGIALARLRALQLIPGHASAVRWRGDLRAGAETTRGFPLTPLPHLCCGTLGRAAILRALGQGMAEPSWCAAADAMTDQIVARADHGDRFVWGLGDVVAQGVEAPGLMQGLAGIGLHLLGDGDQRDLLALIA